MVKETKIININNKIMFNVEKLEELSTNVGNTVNRIEKKLDDFIKKSDNKFIKLIKSLHKYRILKRK